MRSASCFVSSSTTSAPRPSAGESGTSDPAAAGAGWLAAGSRTSPVVGSIRRLSRTTGPWCSSAGSRSSRCSPGRSVTWTRPRGLVDDLGVDDVVVGRVARRRRPRRLRRAPAPAACCSAYIAAPSFWLTVATFSVASLIAWIEPSSVPSSAFFSSADGLLDLGLGRRSVALGELVGVVGQELLGLVDELVAGVADLGLLAAALVLLGVCLGVAHHPLDVVLGQRRAAGDRHRLLLAGAEVLGGDVHDAVGVDVEARPRSAARRAVPAAGRSARTCRASCCTPPSRARPGRPGSAPRAGCRRPW